MRLLNTDSLQFREFFDHCIPSYAILSHRWGSDEATFQDFERGKQQSRGGFPKIRGCCQLAKEQGHEWAWIDTCCIDKKSSAELTEAINSMYKWYRSAQVCYVYMTDVLREKHVPSMLPLSTERFCGSSWWTRGWTLQELLAPRHVKFYDRRWEYIGDKQSLAEEISEITEIDIDYLLPRSAQKPHEPCIRAWNCRGHHELEPSVATRMSWAAKRTTSRIEDMAYCLLGIFGVNMPLLYGEGERAFSRLQEEIIKQSSDDSIFAWSSKLVWGSVLALRPSNFHHSRYVCRRGPVKTHRRPYAITNQGLDLPITWRAWDSKTEELKVLLDCGICGPQGFHNIVLCFESLSGHSWFRTRFSGTETMEHDTWYNPPDQSGPISMMKTAYTTSEEVIQTKEGPLGEMGERIMVEIKADDDQSADFPADTSPAVSVHFQSDTHNWNSRPTRSSTTTSSTRSTSFLALLRLR